MRHLVVDAFFDDARAMRRELDQRLGDRVEPLDERRFVWEHWHVDGQFSQLRTLARSFFPAPLIAAFEARLLRWAATTYGLSRLASPPWLSVVTDGGFQGIHRDGPNGLIAFSFGLGKNGRFRGGETLIARDELLDYFRTGSHRAAVADTPLFDEIAPRMNRLVAFDSRVPHGVRAVEGPRHPRDGRVAIQGWLAGVGCIVAGADPHAVTRVVDGALRGASRRDLAGAEGLFSVRLAVSPTGRVRATDVRASTLARTSDAPRQPARAARTLVRLLARVRFLPGTARVTVPVLVTEGGRARVAGGR